MNNKIKIIKLIPVLLAQAFMQRIIVRVPVVYMQRILISLGPPLILSKRYKYSIILFRFFACTVLFYKTSYSAPSAVFSKG